MSRSPIKILLFSTIFPNSINPLLGLPVDTRLRHLLGDGVVQARVVAPVPWFPWRGEAFGRYGAFARVPYEEELSGVEIMHPRYPVIPRIGATVSPFLLYRAARSSIHQLIRSGNDFDLIDAHHFYPSGVAAVMLGRFFGKPVVITARGSDIHYIPRFALPRRMILWAAQHAAGLVAVAQALADEMARMGIDSDRITVLRNGVDLHHFRPLDRAASRNRYGLSGPVVVSVGNLLPVKGHDLVIRAMPDFPDATLLIAGDGPQAGELNRLVQDLGLSARVRLLGAVSPAEMPQVLNAADVLVLASEREGWPNVLLEAMACGTPVAATDVWGAPEAITSPAAGRVIPRRDPESIRATLRALLDDPPGREAVRAYAEGFGWDKTTKGQIDLFSEILERGGPGECGR